MDKILLWDSDPSLKHAVSISLNSKGFKTVTLDNPLLLPKAVELEDPQLMIIEGEWAPGSRLSFNGNGHPLKPDGALSLIDLSTGSSEPAERGSRGTVLANLRKPFGTEDLFNCVQSALTIKKGLDRTPLPWEQYIEIRRLDSDEDIRAMLNLRYEVYREVGFIGTSQAEIEFDKYDLDSVFLGAFLGHNGDRELVGALRIIRNHREEPHQNRLMDVLDSHGIDCSLSAEDEPSSLPACESFGISCGEISRFCEGFGSATHEPGVELSGEICELSRLVVNEKFRRQQLGIERLLFEMVVIDSCARNPRRNWFIIAVHPSKRRKFERFGFVMLSELGTRQYAGIAQPAILMALDLHAYLKSPNPFTKNLDFNILAFRENGCLLNIMEESTSRQAVVQD